MFDSRLRRASWFLLLLTVTATVFRSPLATLIKRSTNDERYAHLSAIPIAMSSLVLLRRKAILHSLHYCPALGTPIMALGTALSCRAIVLSEFDSTN
jgi:hypothetical protein